MSNIFVTKADLVVIFMRDEDLIFSDLRTILRDPETLRFTHKSPAFAFLKLNMYDETWTVADLDDGCHLPGVVGCRG